MDTFKLILGTLLITAFNTTYCKADDEILPIDITQEETPKDFTQEDIEKLKQNVRDDLAIIASQGDVQDRKRLMKAVERIKKRQIQRANLKLPPEQQKTYQEQLSGYQDVDDFEDYLNDAFMQDLNKIKVPTRVPSPALTSTNASSVNEENSPTTVNSSTTEPEIMSDSSNQEDNKSPQKTSGRRKFSAPK